MQGDVPVIEHADALEWLAAIPASSAAAVVYDPPYAVGTPVRGREDGMAGSVHGPFGFLHRSLTLAAQALRPGGIVLIFSDWRRMADMGYLASISGLRPATCVAWVRNRPGTGGLLRSSWDPVLIAARGVPDAVDRAAIRNVVVADYPARRAHPYQKPAAVYAHVLARACRPGDLVLDPFAGSGSSRDAALGLGLRWRGCDIDPVYAGGNGEDMQKTFCDRCGQECQNLKARLALSITHMTSQQEEVGEDYGWLELCAACVKALALAGFTIPIRSSEGHKMAMARDDFPQDSVRGPMVTSHVDEPEPPMGAHP